MQYLLPIVSPLVDDLRRSLYIARKQDRRGTWHVILLKKITYRYSSRPVNFAERDGTGNLVFSQFGDIFRLSNPVVHVVMFLEYKLP